MTMSEMLARRDRLPGPNVRLFYDSPVHMMHGEGTWLWDADGRKYLDAYNNVAHVGHCHPAVVEAIKRQASTLNTHTRYLHDGILDYVERLVAMLGDKITSAAMVCTGSEANDLAMRMARAATGQIGIIATDHTCHGNTTAVQHLSVTSPPFGGYSTHVRSHYGYFNTFGGNPVSAAAANAVLHVLAAEDLQARALRTGAHLVGGLRRLAGKHEMIGDVRGTGLAIGAAIVSDRSGKTPDKALASRTSTPCATTAR